MTSNSARLRLLLALGPVVAALIGGAVARAETAAPLARMGTTAVAVVEDVTAPAAGVQFMDLVYAGQAIPLGADGHLSLSYLSGCRSETITGGTVTVTPDGALSAGGTVTPSVMAGCTPAGVQIAANATEAGAVTIRGDGEAADGGRVLRGARPAFRWLAGGAGDVRVIDVSQVPSRVMWSGSGAAGWIDYPTEAPALDANKPYRVEVRANGVLVGVARFSIDPALVLPDTLANRLVPVAAP